MENLSDEIVLRIFGLLPARDLCRCSQVRHEFCHCDWLSFNFIRSAYDKVWLNYRIQGPLSI